MKSLNTSRPNNTLTGVGWTHFWKFTGYLTCKHIIQCVILVKVKNFQDDCSLAESIQDKKQVRHNIKNLYPKSALIVKWKIPNVRFPNIFWGFILVATPEWLYACHLLGGYHTGLFFRLPPTNRRLPPTSSTFPPIVGANLQPARFGKESDAGAKFEVKWHSM